MWARRDLNPWLYAYQAYTLTNWVTCPKGKNPVDSNKKDENDFFILYNKQRDLSSSCILYRYRFFLDTFQNFRESGWVVKSDRL